jgi:hypothetical protein
MSLLVTSQPTNQPINQRLTNFYETYYKHYAILCHSNVIFILFPTINSNKMAFARSWNVRATIVPLNLESWNDVLKHPKNM